MDYSKPESSKSVRSNRSLARWIIALSCIAIGVLPLLPPSPQAPESDPTQFSATRAFDQVEAIAREPHPIGSAEIERVRAHILSTLNETGLDPQSQTVEVPDYFGDPETFVEVVNVMARIRGSDPSGALALVAHYDTVPTTPGANDDSAAVATLLEIATILVANPTMKNDVILLFTDGEEPAPRFGSSAFVSEHPWFDDVSFVVNLEASGAGGPSLLIETSGLEGWSVDAFIEAAPYPAVFSFITDISSLLGGIGTDFTPFQEGQIPGLNFAYLHGSPIYHTERDSLASVSLSSLQQQGANTLELARNLGDSDLDVPSGSEGLVFFTVAGSHVVNYPSAWNVALAILVLAMLGAGMIVRWRRPTAGRLGRVIAGLGLVLGALVIAVVAGALIWSLIAGWRPNAGIAESYAYLLLLLGATGGVWLATARLARRQLERDDLLVGVVITWVSLGLLITAFSPGTGYLFLWPALVGTAYWAACEFGYTRIVRSLFSFLVVAAVAIVLILPAIDVFFQMAQPRPGNPDSELIPVAGAATGLAILVIALVHSVATASETSNGDRRDGSP